MLTEKDIEVKTKHRLAKLGVFEKIRCNDNMVIEPNHLVKLRDKISSLYADKKVVVSPCTTKLYLSDQQKQIDFDGKQSPNWSYFGTGVTALIYDSQNLCLKIAVFESCSFRLLWCFNWQSFARFSMPTANFHVLNTDQQSTKHAGLLYENKIVADLILSSLKLLIDQLKTDSEQQQGETTKQTSKILRKLSFRRVKSKDEPDVATKRRSYPWKRKQSSENLLEAATIAETPLNKSDEETNKDSLVKTIFNKRRISRSQSLRSKRLSQQVIATDEPKQAKATEAVETKPCENKTDKKTFQRAKPLIKMRSSTDSLLYGNTMKCMIDTGHSARQTRERKYWVRNLQTVPSTDLCVTEL